jgi:diguanylate cyclase (GGDEF)-like protein
MNVVSFRSKLIIFLVVILIAGQAINLYAVNRSTLDAIIEQTKTQLARADEIAIKHIQAKATQLTDSARIAIQDYNFRTGLVTGEPLTKQSVLRNLADRIKAKRALLIDLDGNLIADTVLPRDQLPSPGLFPFASMLEKSADGDIATEIAVMNDELVRLAVVPVLYPTVAAYVALEIPIDDVLTSELRELSAFPLDISFAYDKAGRGFKVVASSLPGGLRERIVPILGEGPESRPEIIEIGGKQYVSIERSVPVAKESAYVTAFLQFAIDDARAPYRQLLFQLTLILLATLVLSIIAGLAMAQSITRPMTRLALAAKRIGSGDYRAKVDVAGRDEVGQLATAFNQMTAAIGEREERLSHQADHDRLTDLPNRRMLERILTSEIEPGGGVVPVTTLALVGVDRLPEINNTLGHDLGDQLIQGIGPMIDKLKPEGAVLARVSEAVFALMLPGRTAEHSKPIAQAISQAFEHPVRVGSDLAIDANVHIGLATAPQHGQSARVLLQHADVALFGARGSGAITVYDPATDPYKPENLSLMGELRGGIQRGELQLHFQPKIGLGANKMIGAEALVRWIHPKHGFLPPDRFIPLAEESGAIHHLTDWALGSGIHHAKRWRESGLDLKLAVNLSVRDLLNKNLPDLTQRLLSESGMTGDRLILEITESAIMSDPDAAMAVLRRLADQGIKLSVDDFGTGHSSFAYLRKLPISELKIDKSFVLNLSKNSADQTIVRTIVDLAHGLDLKVTAEGVEDEDAYNLLAEFGCDVGQGYFMSRPLTLEKFEAFARDSAYAA